MHSPQADSVRDFRIDRVARRRSVVSGVLKTFAIVFGIYLALKLVTGTPLFSFAYTDLIVLLLVPVLFFARGRWGDRLLFDEQALRIYRGEDLRRTIPLNLIQKVSGGEGAVTVVWATEGRTERQLLSREGFTEEEWSQIQSLLGLPKNA